MHRICLIVAPMLALAACGQEPAGSADGNAATPAREAPAAAATQIQPGQWEATNEVLEMAMPGMPAGMLNDMIGKKTTYSNCVTPEQAARDPGELMVQDTPGGAKCTRDRFTMSGGKMDAAMTCSGGETPGTMRMEITGDYAPTAYQTTVTMTTESPPGAPGGTMKMVSRTTAKRVGDCTAPAGQPG